MRRPPEGATRFNAKKKPKGKKCEEKKLKTRNDIVAIQPQRTKMVFVVPPASP